jgi:fatty-acyl-CoA synthase
VLVIPRRPSTRRATLEAVAAEALTSLYGVPTMFIAMLDQDRTSTTDLARCAPGSWPARRAPIEVMKKVVDRCT